MERFPKSAAGGAGDRHVGHISGLYPGVLAAAVMLLPSAWAEELASADLADLSIEELAEVDITSVSKQKEKLSNAPASIYVITADDIRRSGSTTIPEILRLAPNLQVARRDSVQYAISARGFNNAVGNKLLVLIDGRTVYTPLFSGVFWEMQDTMIEDIDRIEVISGPGATLWGANAVNGVINIITDPSSDTQGTLTAVDAGNIERGAAVRHGGSLGEQGSYRIYGKVRNWSNTEFEDGTDVRDEWDRGQFGFRADWEKARDTFTLQGDTFRGESEHRGFAVGMEIPELEISGTNLLGRWTRRLEGGSETQLQVYYNRIERDDIVQFQPESEVVDVEFQHAIPLEEHSLLWGAGYRRGHDQVDPGFLALFRPDSRELEWENVFVQDEIRLNERTTATLGLRLESNDYTGWEYLPNARLAWKPTDDRLVWTSLSRAVRAPSRLDRDVGVPAGSPFDVVGGPGFVSEVAHVFELGYRAQPMETLSYSITGFYHDWDELRSGTAPPIEIENGIQGELYGIEAWGSFQPMPFWVLKAGLLRMEKHLELEEGSTDPVGVDSPTLHNDPDYQWSLHSSFDLPGNASLDLYLRGVDELTVEEVPDYTELGLRAAWKPSSDVEVSVVGRNLLHESHAEFGAAATRSEIERSVLIALRVSL